MILKERGIHKPEKTQKLREILKSVLDIVTVIDTNHEQACTATDDTCFDDIEDSMQYQCAIGGNCNCIITFNNKDFKNADLSKIQVLTPDMFLNR